MKNMQPTEIKKIYFIGIEGAGTSALAKMYKNFGHKVSGSDDGDHFYGDVLSAENIKVLDYFDAKNIPSDVDWVVYSTAFKDDNPEIQEAKKRKLKMIPYSQALGDLFNEKMGIAVCGTHGKTTTTAIVANIFQDAGLDPCALVGSKVIQWKGNSLAGKGEYFIIEADEYQNKLQNYNPWSVILTSVDYDHPDFFKTFEDYKKAFKDFVAKIPQHGFLICYGDDSSVLEVTQSASCPVFKYGFLEGNDYRIIFKDNGEFQLNFQEKNIGDFKIKIPGKHNILNSVAALIVAHRVGIETEKIKKSLESFKGTNRRFEYVGEKNGAILIDDYAHHPEEVKASLKAARGLYPEKNIITIFHPHSYSRTEALLHEFSQSFDDCDKVIMLDIYGSAREKSGNVNSKTLVDLINKYDFKKAEHIPTIPEVISFLNKSIGANDVVISMGAGDVWRVTHELATSN
ncbi:MAG: hypothetical protein ACD_11C00024G0033 [uncultured bacterium]|nr:MAG: hypothetical protein ACD_11C00024G0033 [uncultured bacterium]HBR71957.1 UDP-N-acetylmuramate--L-alanine ligase [Candidatus Moranbacteria bacterium]